MTSARLGIAVLLLVALGGGFALGWTRALRPAAGPGAVPPAEAQTRAADASAAAGTDSASAGSNGIPRWYLTQSQMKDYDLSSLVGRAVVSGPVGSKQIALTFDDGPTVNTPAVLDILDRYHARATFFFIGYRIGQHPDSARRVVREGSEIANHTWDHAMLKGLPAAKMREEIARTQDAIARTTGVRNEFVRPRSGEYNRTGLQVVGEMGLILAGWDASGMDSFQYGQTAADIERIAIAQTRDGSIVLLHEVNPETLKALPRILGRLQRAGYRFVTLGELLAGR